MEAKSNHPQGRYFLFNWDKERQIKVHKMITQEEPAQFDSDAKLFWFDFNAREHFSQVKSHKKFIVKSYERFKNLFPNLNLDIVKSHDDSKFSFVETLGYTDRWVNGEVSSKCWSLGNELSIHKDTRYSVSNFQPSNITLVSMDIIQSFTWIGTSRVIQGKMT